MEKPIYDPSAVQQEFHLCNADEALIGGSGGPGKAIAIDTPIFTSTGWKTMATLRIGDAIFDDAGNSCRVTWKSEIWNDRPCFKVTFDDGSSIVADAEHEWLSYPYAARISLTRQANKAHKRKLSSPYYNDQRHKCTRERIVTTRQIAETVMDGKNTNHALKIAAPLTMPSADLPLDPYVLGAWLGDGTSNGGQITSADDEVIDQITSAGWAVKKLRAKYLWAIDGLTQVLSGMGVRKNKHIPQTYLQSSHAQRLALLQGLVDTDGHVDRDGRVEVTLCCERLARQTHELVWGLGMKATITESDATLYGRIISRRWRICWSPCGVKCARLTRKADKLGNGARTQKWRYIISATPVDSVPTQCIEVDSPSHLYLAGMTLAPTHNSLCLLMDPIQTQLVFEHERWLRGDIQESVGKAIHFRREYPMLGETLDRAQRIFPKIDPKVHWDGDAKTFRFSCGYKYQFAHLKDSGDWRIYDSNQYTHISFDELWQFEMEQYQRLTKRCRTSDPVLMKRKRVRAATIPSGNWVRKYYVDSAPMGRTMMRTRIILDDGTEEQRTRIFIPALLRDNPDIAFRRDYEANLKDSPPHIRLALLNGDWYVVAGAFFAEEWDPAVHVVEPFPIPSGWFKFRSMDWGYKSPGVVLWWAVDTDSNLICYREFTFSRMDAETVAEKVQEIEDNAGEWDFKKRCSRLSGPADTQIWETRGTIGPTIQESMQKVGVYWEKATKNRLAATHQLLKRLKDRTGEKQTPAIRFFKTCRNTIRTIPAMETDANNPELPKDGGDDHWLDAVSYGCMYRLVTPKENERPHSQEFYDEIDEARRKQSGRQRAGGRHGYGGF